MTNLYIIRHAQSIGNIEKRLTGKQDYKLTKEGTFQVEKLTNKLEKICFDCAYSSTSIRAIDTIKPLVEKSGLKINLIPELREMYFGIYDGYKWEEVNKLNPNIHKMHIKTNEIIGIPKQETTQEVAERMYNVILKIAKDNKNKNILIASHGVAIEAFLRKISGDPFIIKIEEYSQKNASINKVVYNEDRNEFIIEILNNNLIIKKDKDIGR